MVETLIFIADLIGFSGCKIKLYSQNGKYFVRKISKSFSYNKRLEKQMLKQEYFIQNLSTKKITAPKILKKGFIEGFFFFDMEYVQGLLLINYINEANGEQLLDVLENIHSLISIMKNSVEIDKQIDLYSCFKKKAEEIRLNLINRGEDVLEIVADLKESIQTLEESLGESNKINPTFCHGDLTMENIIYDKINEKYYLIDFLDTFVDHYWLDIVKLFQDIDGQWYKFRNPDVNLNNMVPKMNFMGKFLENNLLKNEHVYKNNHHLFLAMNFSRILPYSQKEDLDYLVKTIRGNLIKFRKSSKRT